ncbi:MAG: type II toxin-antitoxin system RelE/ParE family toxin [Sulfuricella sp.]|nr:type II toxin-antitoxin system RelE/ParE family toxin [Sulfuricella sp.]
MFKFKPPCCYASGNGWIYRSALYKFDCVNQRFLLAYSWDETRRVLLALGPHENFYRDLKH